MITQDLSKFGYREIDMAADLLKKYIHNNDTQFFMGDGLQIEFNTNSGNVFLIDEDMNVAMMNGDTLEDFFSCPECGHEGFLDEMEHNSDNKGCREYLKTIKKG